MQTLDERSIIDRIRNIRFHKICVIRHLMTCDNYTATSTELNRVIGQCCILVVPAISDILSISNDNTEKYIYKLEIDNFEFLNYLLDFILSRKPSRHRLPYATLYYKESDSLDDVLCLLKLQPNSFLVVLSLIRQEIPTSELLTICRKISSTSLGTRLYIGYNWYSTRKGFLRLNPNLDSDIVSDAAAAELKHRNIDINLDEIKSKIDNPHIRNFVFMFRLNIHKLGFIGNNKAPCKYILSWIDDAIQDYIDYRDTQVPLVSHRGCEKLVELVDERLDDIYMTDNIDKSQLIEKYQLSTDSIFSMDLISMWNCFVVLAISCEYYLRFIDDEVLNFIDHLQGYIYSCAESLDTLDRESDEYDFVYSTLFISELACHAATLQLHDKNFKPKFKRAIDDRLYFVEILFPSFAPVETVAC